MSALIDRQRRPDNAKQDTAPRSTGLLEADQQGEFQGLLVSMALGTAKRMVWPMAPSTGSQERFPEYLPNEL